MPFVIVVVSKNLNCRVKVYESLTIDDERKCFKQSDTAEKHGIKLLIKH